MISFEIVVKSKFLFWVPAAAGAALDAGPLAGRARLRVNARVIEDRRNGCDGPSKY